MRDWLARQFSTDWTPLRFQPILFLSCWIGTWLAWLVETSDAGARLSDGFAAALGPWGWPAWLALSLSTPIMLVAAYACVYAGSGYTRYMGFWLRLGADAGQLAAVVAFLVTFADQRGVTNDYRVYFVTLSIGIVAFLLVMVIRDVWQLLLAERIASELRAVEAEALADE